MIHFVPAGSATGQRQGLFLAERTHRHRVTGSGGIGLLVGCCGSMEAVIVGAVGGFFLASGTLRALYACTTSLARDHCPGSLIYRRRAGVHACEGLAAACVPGDSMPVGMLPSEPRSDAGVTRMQDSHVRTGLISAARTHPTGAGGHRGKVVAGITLDHHSGS